MCLGLDEFCQFEARELASSLNMHTALELAENGIVGHAVIRIESLFDIISLNSL